MQVGTVERQTLGTSRGDVDVEETMRDAPSAASHFLRLIRCMNLAAVADLFATVHALTTAGFVAIHSKRCREL